VTLSALPDPGPGMRCPAMQRACAELLADVNHACAAPASLVHSLPHRLRGSQACLRVSSVAYCCLQWLTARG